MLKDNQRIRSIAHNVVEELKKRFLFSLFVAVAI